VSTDAKSLYARLNQLSHSFPFDSEAAQLCGEAAQALVAAERHARGPMIVRLEAALAKLRAAGWNNRMLDAALDGLLIEDMVEKAERFAEAA